MEVIGDFITFCCRILWLIMGIGCFLKVINGPGWERLWGLLYFTVPILFYGYFWLIAPKKAREVSFLKWCCLWPIVLLDEDKILWCLKK